MSMAMPTRCQLMFQMLSRNKPANAGVAPAVKEKQKKQEMPKLEDFLVKRDYTGAITLVEVRNDSQPITAIHRHLLFACRQFLFCVN